MARAKELLDLITSPTALVTGVLLVFSRGQLTKNNSGTIDKPMTWWALVAAMAGCAIAVVIVAVMTPLALRVVVRNNGGIETRLLVYCLMYLVAVGTAAYAGTVAYACTRHLN